jgi:Ca2+-binding EF-hand superfamily protein
MNINALYELIRGNGDGGITVECIVQAGNRIDLEITRQQAENMIRQYSSDAMREHEFKEMAQMVLKEKKRKRNE